MCPFGRHATPILILVVLLASCAPLSLATIPANSAPSTVPTTTRQEAPSWLKTLQAIQTLQPSPQPPQPTRTLVASPILAETCATRADGAPQNATGSLFIRMEEGIVLIDMATGENLSLLVPPDRDVFQYPEFFQLVSPDYRLLALFDGPFRNYDEPGTLRIVDGRGNDVAPIASRSTWETFTGWLSESVVAIAVKSDRRGTVAAYAPFSQSEDLLYPTFPDIFSWDLPPRLDWYGQAEVALYNRSLTRVVYAVRSPEGMFLRLWDSTLSRDLWTSPPLGWAYDPPAWSPDGLLLAIPIEPIADPASESLLVLSPDGAILHSREFPSAVPGFESRVIPYKLSWSPTGDRIAFWILHGDSSGTLSGATLGLMEIATGEVFDSCVASPTRDYIPIWSPDGRFLAANGIILDTLNMQMYTLHQDAIAIGWLTSTQ